MEKRSSSVFRIDESVYYTMGSVSIICGVILCFGFRHSNTCNHPDLKITKSAAHYYTRSLIAFKAETTGGSRFRWNYGDSENDEDGGSSATHEYKQPGTYTVTVLVDGVCDQVTTVEISDAPIVKNPNLVPTIIFPDTALVNFPVDFRDLTADATSWEWHFGNSKTVEANSPKVSHSFSVPGHHEIYLRVNGKPDRYTIQDIFIIDPRSSEEAEKANASKLRKPAPDIQLLPRIPLKPTADPLAQGSAPAANDKPVVKTDPKKVADLSSDDLEGMLRNVVSGKIRASDFSEYLRGDLNIKVKYNEEIISFTKMCEKLREIKKIKDIKKLEVVSIGKDTATNAIKYLNVNASRKGLLGRTL